MIHTKERANQFTVFVSACRADKADQAFTRTNELRAWLKEYPAHVGVCVEEVTGVYREAGAHQATYEHTFKVECEDIMQVQRVCRYATFVFEQDCILVVNSQTHTAFLMSLDDAGFKTMPLSGVMQPVDCFYGEAGTIDSKGQLWEVR
ncbi:S-adenosyl-L-methionine hydrolase [Pectobacterium phage PP47]|uniref:S-adenosyl-L-methionine hydrolase n=2 Tax=Pektosvirus TaxID=2732689 RepID=A0A1L7DRX6_9CAUD|nr:SAM-dependent methyltransferase [Pectobacterium phage PP81]YP_009788698.1 SAM-dependent methyltransferase [Pectobacterium phage PP47]APU03029.1 S-adenosyl-L-methionine hydrolase [Pectobacterium phage PP81]APW79746.1 S-adenosyl-L-methionine hydrolase [Pectobacterium phage PP47]